MAVTWTFGLWDFLLLLLMAAIIGAIGEAIAGYSTGGCLMSTVIGFIGGLLGHWLQHALRLPTLINVHVAGHNFPVIWSVIGAALLVLILRLILGRRRAVVVD